MSVLYHMSHQLDDKSLHVSLLSNRKLDFESKFELGEELSHFPHSDRRAFIEEVHSLYQRTTCIEQIIQQLTNTAYYNHILEQKQKLVGLMLKYNRPSRYHYMIFIESV